MIDIYMLKCELIILLLILLVKKVAGAVIAHSSLSCN